jgi:hypothetical protein
MVILVCVETPNMQGRLKLIIERFCKTIFSKILNRNTRCYYHFKEECLQFQSDHDVKIAVGTRVEPPQNCYIAQIPGHTNYARSVRQPFPSNTELRFSQQMAVAIIGPFQMLHSHEFHDLATLPTQVMV